MPDNQCPDLPFVYPNTEVRPQVGDRVRFHESREPLVVVAVIDDPEKQRNCGVMEFGIMLKGWGYGLVFTGIDERELEFVSRDEKLES